MGISLLKLDAELALAELCPAWDFSEARHPKMNGFQGPCSPAPGIVGQVTIFLPPPPPCPPTLLL